jgi:predicted RecB family nuclease
MRFTEGTFQLAATDLSNHLGCAHLTQLNRKLARRELDEPRWYDPSLEILIQRGKDHEAAYVEFLSNKGLKVVNLNGKSQDEVVEHMRLGTDVLVQARLQRGLWVGHADILLKVGGRSKFGNWSYEVQDTKLAQNTRAGTILQLCLYTDIVGELQGAAPERMYVVKPGDNFPAEDYRFAEFHAYYRLVKRNFEDVMQSEAVETYPDPTEQCNICRWWQVCDRKRHDDDHLSLVAGMRSLHVVELQRQGIETLEAFANTAKIEKPERGSRETFERKQSQAKVQREGRLTQSLVHKFLPVEPGRGLNRLPEPNAGDVYFDIEGDNFFPDGGLEYVLGYAYREEGKLKYNRTWSTDRKSEKKAFVEFMQFVVQRWKRYPKMYIYHFAPYEPSAIKRLARVHAVFEKETDELLRAERFIDLHAVFKESLLASVETYSLKELERFTKYARNVKLHDASSARKSVEIALELGEFRSLSRETIKLVEDYNEDDCLATEALHAWLEDMRSHLLKQGVSVTRPESKTGEASENVQNMDTRAQALFRSLTNKLPEDRATWTEEHKVRWLLAHQIEYFRREDKSAWWEFYRVHEMDHEELMDERKAITGLQFVRELPKQGRDRNITHQYKFPPQEMSIDEGDDLVEVKGNKIGSVRGISLENYTIDIKKSATSVDIHPFAIHVSERVDPGTLATSLMDLATSIDEDGLSREWSYHAAKDLLMKRPPTLVDGAKGVQLLPDEDVVDGAVRIAANMNRSVLAIQGPPGAGKTFTGATMIINLAKAGKRIGITAVSHKVIRNLTQACIERSKELGGTVSFVHKVKEEGENVPPEILEVDKSEKVRAGLPQGKIACGTAWLWAEDSSREILDYLFVDEAGQMSLSQVLAASRAAKNLILLGDPQQLEQPQRGAHPEGSDVAALTYLLDGHETMPEGKGLFLSTTRRLHPSICRFTSELFYEGRLHSLPELDKQVISGGTPFDGAGLSYVPVIHRGNQNRSREEVAAIEQIVAQLLVEGKWTNVKGETRPLKREDILIVAPYNAQVSALLEKLPDMRIGTVDKFQGQEAPIVIYSMTASTVEDAPKGMNFLFDPHRINVATSRAKSRCILVASPRLLEPECKTIDQLRWANSLCRYLEILS